MVETRPRDFKDLIGAPAARILGGTSLGSGFGPALARLAARDTDAPRVSGAAGDDGIFSATADLDFGDDSVDWVVDDLQGADAVGHTIFPPLAGLWLCHMSITGTGLLEAALVGGSGRTDEPGAGYIPESDGAGSTVAMSLIFGDDSGFTFAADGSATDVHAYFFGFQLRRI